MRADHTTEGTRRYAFVKMDGYGLIEDGWTFKISHRMTKALGKCHWPTKTITLAWWVVQRLEWPDVRDVILHEIAHALAGQAEGHSNQWKKYAVMVGARPERLATPTYWKAPSQERPRLWALTCTTCNKTHPRKNRVNPSRFRCKCGGTLTLHRAADAHRSEVTA